MSAPPDYFVTWWDGESNQFMNPVELQFQLAHESLGILALIRGFDLPDLALIAETAAGSGKWANDIAAVLEKETGIRFKLTPRQWGVIHSEVQKLIEERTS